MAKKPKNVEAVAYMRTSSAANVGADKDSDKRQRLAIQRYARTSGYSIADGDWYYDAAVSGADPIEGRAGFAALLARIESNGVRVVIVESADRFARQLMTQELGVALLRTRGVTLLTANGDDMTANDDPTRTMLRQITGSFAEFEKARLVQKLKGARERKREATGRCEGRRPVHALYPEATREAKRLHRASPLTHERRSLRQISAELAKAGHVARTGKPFSASAVQRMIDAPAGQKHSD